MLMPVGRHLLGDPGHADGAMHYVLHKLVLSRGGSVNVPRGETVDFPLEFLATEATDWLSDQRCTCKLIGVWDGIQFHLYVDLPADQALLWKLTWGGKHA